MTFPGMVLVFLTCQLSPPPPVAPPRDLQKVAANWINTTHPHTFSLQEALTYN